MQLTTRLKKLESVAQERRAKVLEMLTRAYELMSIPDCENQPPFVERLNYWAAQQTNPHRRRIAELLLLGKTRYEQKSKAQNHKA